MEFPIAISVYKYYGKDLSLTCEYLASSAGYIDVRGGWSLILYKASVANVRLRWCGNLEILTICICYTL